MNLQESLNVAMDQPELIGRTFYSVFFQQCPEAVRHFEGIDMKRQEHVVTMSLIIVAQLHSHGFTATLDYLRYLGTKHSDRQIPKPLYQAWRTAMLATLKAVHGNNWTGDLQQEWESALDAAVSLMLEGYDTRMTV